MNGGNFSLMGSEIRKLFNLYSYFDIF